MNGSLDLYTDLHKWFISFKVVVVEDLLQPTLAFFLFIFSKLNVIVIFLNYEPNKSLKLHLSCLKWLTGAAPLHVSCVTIPLMALHYIFATQIWCHVISY